MQFYLPTLKHLVIQLTKLQIYTLNLTTTFWHCKKKSHYFWTGVYIWNKNIYMLNCLISLFLYRFEENILVLPDILVFLCFMQIPNVRILPLRNCDWLSELKHWNDLQQSHVSYTMRGRFLAMPAVANNFKIPFGFRRCHIWPIYPNVFRAWKTHQQNIMFRIKLCIRPANETRLYLVTSPLIGRAHTQNDPFSTNASRAHISSVEPIKDTPYLALTGQPWPVCCDQRRKQGHTIPKSTSNITHRNCLWFL